ncbi:PepSY domain-containing protein [Achromobacter sp. Root170]|uniref:PepSY-associated TM helix domain-containing protein n=1 Tax=Achromobacter sp. Root170 TaxID=1736480 RepID=UPI0007013396|nr:PepSY-associated TM helix domain-containing protein [Achromobacter sp. Root170]KRB10771.1 hypothetical protein ASD87_16505 [Achromobacter sp. Root170]
MPSSLESSAGTLAEAKTRSSARRLWFDLHSWIGMNLCLLLGFIFCTGTLAVVATEIDWLIEPAMRVAPQDRQASWGEMLAAAERAHPGLRLRSLAAPHGERFAAEALMRRDNGELLRVWVNPHTAQVTGQSSWWSAQRWLRDTHRNLMLPPKYGVPLVALLSIPLLLMVISSLYIYKRWWRGFLAWPRKGKPRLTWGDVHRLAGVWSLGFMLLIGVTAFWYLAESLGAKAPLPPTIVQLKGTATHAPLAAQDLDRAISAAQAAWPDLKISSVRPSPNGKALLLEGQANGWLLRERANVIGVEIDSGAILGRNDGQDMTVHQRIGEAADPLHFGTFGGWPVRALWCFFGILLTTLSLTGAYLYGIRIAESARTALKRRGAPAGAPHFRDPSAWAAAWRRMGRWRWLAGGLLGMWLALVVIQALK